MKKKIKPRGYWTLEVCQRDASLYLNRKLWKQASRGYDVACEKGWIELCCSHMKLLKKPENYWTFETCSTDAKLYTSRKSWFNSSTAAQVASRNNWLEDCCKHMIPLKKIPNYWTFQRCKKEASNFTTQKEWKMKSNSSYVIAFRRGWKKELTKNMTLLCQRDKWNLKTLKKDALKYESRIDWMNNSNGYVTASRKNLLKECCEHMKHYAGSSSMEKELFKLIKLSYPTAESNKWFGVKKQGSYGNRFQLDIYIPELNRGIEFNGTYWHSVPVMKKSKPNWKVEDVENYHEIKKTFFKTLGLEYIDVLENDWILDPKDCFKKCNSFLKEDSK